MLIGSYKNIFFIERSENGYIKAFCENSENRIKYNQKVEFSAEILLTKIDYNSFESSLKNIHSFFLNEDFLNSFLEFYDNFVFIISEKFDFDKSFFENCRNTIIVKSNKMDTEKKYYNIKNNRGDDYLIIKEGSFFGNNYEIVRVKKLLNDENHLKIFDLLLNNELAEIKESFKVVSKFILDLYCRNLFNENSIIEFYKFHKINNSKIEERNKKIKILKKV